MSKSFKITLTLASLWVGVDTKFSLSKGTSTYKIVDQLNRSKAALPHFHAQSSPPRELCTKEPAQPSHRGDTRQCEGCAGSFVERLRHCEQLHQTQQMYAQNIKPRP